MSGGRVLQGRVSSSGLSRIDPECPVQRFCFPKALVAKGTPCRRRSGEQLCVFVASLDDESERRFQLRPANVVASLAQRGGRWVGACSRLVKVSCRPRCRLAKVDPTIDHLSNIDELRPSLERGPTHPPAEVPFFDHERILWATRPARYVRLATISTRSEHLHDFSTKHAYSRPVHPPILGS